MYHFESKKTKTRKLERVLTAAAAIQITIKMQSEKY